MQPPIESATGVEVLLCGRRYVSFAGCDSLGLARHPEVIAAAQAALSSCGLGASASRTTTGTWTQHVAAEKSLAAWLSEEDAVLLAGGYVAAAALARTLVPECDQVLLDAGAHPALRDAARLTGLPVREFPHFDARSAAAAVPSRPLVLTDAVDVAAGALAPLRALASLAAKRRGHLVVDDAHGVGVLGPGGRGTVAVLRAGGPHVHVAGSLSKALGAHGGFVAGTRDLCDRVRATFPAYAGATPVPPSTAAAVAVAIHLASNGDALRRSLRANSVLLARRFRALGLTAPRAGLPWFSVAGRPARELRAVSSALTRDGFLVPHLTYFGAPRGGYLKIALTAAHERRHVEALAASLARHLGAASGPRVAR